MTIRLDNRQLKKLGIDVPSAENKYKAQKITVDGKTYASLKEAHRHCELVMLQKAGIITELQEQVVFELIPKQYDESGKLLERACKYIADFVYTENGKTVVEDAKGLKTEVYKIKRKLMLFRYGIRIREV